VDLIGAMRTAPVEAYRALAAILLRGITLRESHLWQEALSAEDFAVARREMLAALTSEPSPFIQRKIVDTVAMHAKLGEWPELMEAVITMMHTPEEANSSTSVTGKWKIVSLQLIDKLAEYVGKFLVSANNFNVTMSVITAGLATQQQQQTAAIHSSAYLALCSVLFEVEDSVLTESASVRSHLQSLPAFLHSLHALGDDNNLVDLLTAIGRLMKDKPQVIAICAPALFNVCLPIALNTAPSAAAASPAHVQPQSQLLDEGTRISGIDICTVLLMNPTTSRVCSNATTRQQLLQALIQLIIQIDTDSDANDMGGLALLSKPESGQGFGDVDADNDDDSNNGLVEYSGMCLSTVAESFSDSEVVRVVMASAQTLLQQQADWRCLRAAFFVVSTICDPCRDCLEPYLQTLVQTAVAHTQATAHPRVRFSAVHCISVLIEVYGGNGDDNDEEDEEDDEPNATKLAEPTFQERFHSTIVPTVFACVSANMMFPRIVYMCLYAMRQFFDPDNNTMSPAVVEGYAPTVIASCVSLLSTPVGLPQSQIPTFVLQEVAALLGNICVVVSRTHNEANSIRLIHIVQEKYASIMQCLLLIMQTQSPEPARWWLTICPVISASSTPQAAAKLDAYQSELSALKGSCLECFTLVGTAIGCEGFKNDALMMLQTLVAAQQALDSADILLTYIMHACARIAGVIKEHFVEYLPLVLPLLLARVAEPITVTVTDTESSATSSQPQGADSNGQQQFNLYRRGVGEVSIQCDMHQVSTKEATCRVLGQYFRDVPALMAPYVCDCANAVVPNVDSVQLSEQLAIICGSLLCECVKLYVNYTAQVRPTAHGTISRDERFSELVNVSIHSMCTGVNKLQRVRQTVTHQYSATAQVTCDLLAFTRELMRHVWDYRQLLVHLADQASAPDVTFDANVLGQMLVVYRDEAVGLMNDIIESANRKQQMPRSHGYDEDEVFRD
jgi:hypothetical protein